MQPQPKLSTWALFVLLGFAHAADTLLRNGHPRFGALGRRDVGVCRDVDSNLSNIWKCPSGRVCVSLDNSTSALCCPSGSDCSTIGVIECDAKKQDPSKNPGTEVFTTKTDADLPQCGSSCCPFGYTCSNRDQGFVCTMEKDKARFVGNFPGDVSSTPSSTTSNALTSTSSTSTTTSSSTSTSSAAKSTGSGEGSEQAHHNPFPPGVFLAGFAPGVLVGGLLVGCWFGYRRRAKSQDNSAQSTPHPEKRPVISEPMASGPNQWRTDFSRKAKRRTRSIFASSEHDYNSESNPWKMPKPPVPNQAPVRLDPPITPTPIPDRDRVPTMESIKIYSPPNFDQHPSAAVSPLRTKDISSKQQDNRFGSPFVSPINADAVPRYDNPIRPDRVAELEARPPSSVYDAKSRPASSQYEYSGDPQQRHHPDPAKRDTSFTALMEHCGLPDAGDPYPVPKIPEQYRGTR